MDRIDNNIVHNISKHLRACDVANVFVSGINNIEHEILGRKPLYKKLASIFHSDLDIQVGDPYYRYEPTGLGQFVHLVTSCSPLQERYHVLPFEIPSNSSELTFVLYEKEGWDNWYNWDVYTVFMIAKKQVPVFSYWREISLDGFVRDDLITKFDTRYVIDQVNYSDITPSIHAKLLGRGVQYATAIPTLQYGTICDALLDGMRVFQGAAVRVLTTLDKDKSSVFGDIMRANGTTVVDTTTIADATTIIGNIHDESKIKRKPKQLHHMRSEDVYYAKDMSDLCPQTPDEKFQLDIAGPVPLEALRPIYGCFESNESYATMYEYIHFVDGFVLPHEKVWFDPKTMVNNDRLFFQYCDATRGITVIPYSIRVVLMDKTLHIHVYDMDGNMKAQHAFVEQLYISSLPQQIRAICEMGVKCCSDGKSRLTFSGTGRIASRVVTLINDMFVSLHTEYDFHKLKNYAWTAPNYDTFWKELRVREAPPIETYEFHHDFERLMFVFSAQTEKQSAWPTSLVYVSQDKAMFTISRVDCSIKISGTNTSFYNDLPYMRVVEGGATFDASFFPAIGDVIPGDSRRREYIVHDYDIEFSPVHVKVQRDFFNKSDPPMTYEKNVHIVRAIGEVLRVFLAHNTVSACKVHMSARRLNEHDRKHHKRVIEMMGVVSDRVGGATQKS